MPAIAALMCEAPRARGDITDLQMVKIDLRVLTRPDVGYLPEIYQVCVRARAHVCVCVCVCVCPCACV